MIAILRNLKLDMFRMKYMVDKKNIDIEFDIEFEMIKNIDIE